MWQRGAPLWAEPSGQPRWTLGGPVRAHWAPAWVFGVGRSRSIQHVSPGLDAEVRMSLGIEWLPGLPPVHKASS